MWIRTLNWPFCYWSNTAGRRLKLWRRRKLLKRNGERRGLDLSPARGWAVRRGGAICLAGLCAAKSLDIIEELAVCVFAPIGSGITLQTHEKIEGELRKSIVCPSQP